MASIGRDAGGRRRILFVASDGKRKTIRLGKVSQRTAETVKTKVDALVVAAITGSPIEDEIARWVAGLDSGMADKLATVGLIGRRRKETLKSFLDSFIQGRTDVKIRTTWIYRATANLLLDYFGPEKSIHEITPANADEWRRWLIERGMADNTVRRRSGIAKQFFRQAVRQKLIAENPFADLVAAVRRNEKRYYFITRHEARRVLEACPDAQWRLIFALSRFGALPSILGYAGAMWIGNAAESRYIAPRRNITKAGRLGKSPFPPRFAHILRKYGSKLSQGRNTSSPAIETPTRTDGPSWSGSSARRVWNLGPSRSKTSVQPAKPNWRNPTQFKWCANGLATRRRWRPSITSK